MVIEMAGKKSSALTEIEKNGEDAQLEGLSIEEIFGQLDGVLRKLEDGEISLEESFKYYESGMKLVKACSGKIDRVEKQILVLNENEIGGTGQ